MKDPGKHTLLSALRILPAAGSAFPVDDEVTSLPSTRNAKPGTRNQTRDSSRGILLGALGTAGEASGTAACAITALGKASAAHQVRHEAHLQAYVAQVVASGTAGNALATAGKPSGTAVFAIAPAVKASAAAADGLTTGSDAFPTIATASPAGSIAFPAASEASTDGSIGFPRASVGNPAVSDTISTVSDASLASARMTSAIPHAFSLTLTLLINFPVADDVRRLHLEVGYIRASLRRLLPGSTPAISALEPRPLRTSRLCGANSGAGTAEAGKTQSCRGRGQLRVPFAVRQPACLRPHQSIPARRRLPDLRSPIFDLPSSISPPPAPSL